MALTHLDQLGPHARDMATRAMDWMDGEWDGAARLLRAPAGSLYEDAAAEAHLVRETGWYALGLLLRDADGDRDRALQAIATLLRYQHDAPGQPFHGTWYRSPDEPPPPADPVIWRDYDPNWREFIGTTLAVILIEYGTQLPPELEARIDIALRRAIAGSLERGVPASYTNIALMTAFLLDFGAARFGVPAWAEVTERLAEQIQERFALHGTFDEYNSPTYYGIDLYALGLWRAYATSATLRAAGAALEAALWLDIAQFYHADLQNMAGPYDRSYGMDLRAYVACLGLWIWLATGYEQAPVPRISGRFEHAWDVAAAPLFALIGARVPDRALAQLRSFDGERQLRRVIPGEPERVATAWLAERVMLGGQDSRSSFRVRDAQFHPVTIHWRTGEQSVGWIKTGTTEPVDAWVEPGRLRIVCSAHAGGDVVLEFHLHAPAIMPERLGSDRWDLPGLSVAVASDADEVHVADGDDTTIVRYLFRERPASAPIQLVLDVTGG